MFIVSWHNSERQVLCVVKETMDDCDRFRASMRDNGCDTMAFKVEAGEFSRIPDGRNHLGSGVFLGKDISYYLRVIL